jgi:hypothetical protein
MSKGIIIIAIAIAFLPVIAVVYCLINEQEKFELLKDKERVDWMVENSNLTREYIDNAMGK